MPEKNATLAFALAVALACLLLSPATHGVFLLDDFPNLQRLALIVEPWSLPQLMNFAFSGDAGVGGRVLPMVSFALQSDAWPSSPSSFKQANLVLHALNGILVFHVLKRLGAQWRGEAHRAAWIGAFVATAWLIHPLNVSTVFYVVQRMTMMSATFVLLGLLFYLDGRALVARGRKSGYVWATFGVLGGTLMAAACKETGVLLPLYALVIEATLLQEHTLGTSWHRWRLCCLAAPLAVVSIYFVLHAPAWIHDGYALRPFTLPERVLTEFRVLCHYLLQIIAPQPAHLGLFHDDFSLSRTWFSPPTTILSAGFLLSLLAGALVLRKRLPIVAFGILWFFAGHVLESSIIPLEIYFEHRNYLPMLGILYMAAAGGLAISQHSEKLSLRFWRRLGGVWLLLIGFVGWQQALLWGNPPRQALAWAQQHPNSLRAQHHLAGFWMLAGQPEKAERIYRQMAERNGGDAGATLVWLSAGCRNKELALPDNAELLKLLLDKPAFQHGVPAILDSMVSAKEEGGCERIESTFLENVIQALIDNPHYVAYRAGFLALLGRARASAGLTDLALQAYDQSMKVAPSAEVAMLMVKTLVSAGRFAEARQALNVARGINRIHSPLLRRSAYAHEIERWAAAIERVDGTQGVNH